jgi:SAM-dependent methyltransferase
MRYTQFDYHPTPSEGVGDTQQMAAWWSDHWDDRIDLKRDLHDEPLWATIEDVIDRPGRILEAGCGPGQWVQFFDKLGHTTVGVDYASTALQAGKRVNRALRMLAADLRRLPFPDESFDYICSNGAVEHDIEGPEAALRELHRVLRASGRLMCSVPCLNVERRLLLGWLVTRDWLKRREWLRRLAGKADPFEFYQYVYSPGTYRSILERCGFEVLALRPYGVPAEGSVRRLVARLFGQLSNFYNPHMMMAICRKRSPRAASQGVSTATGTSDKLQRRLGDANPRENRSAEG